MFPKVLFCHFGHSNRAAQVLWGGLNYVDWQLRPAPDWTGLCAGTLYSSLTL